MSELRVQSDRDKLTLSRDGDSIDGAGCFEVTKVRRKLVVYAPGDSASA